MRQQLAIPRAWRLARATAIDPNPANVIARAGTFAASTPDGTVLVTRRDAEGLGHYIFAPDTARVGDAAMTLAQTLGARLDPLDTPPDVFASRHMVVARHRADGRGAAVSELATVATFTATVRDEFDEHPRR